MGGWREAGWPLGAVQSGAAEAIPEGGVARLYDGTWPDDGMPERRGGSTYKSSALFGSGGINWLWTGKLAGGTRTVFHDGTTVGALANDDTTAAAISSISTFTPDLGGGADPVVMNGLLWVPKTPPNVAADIRDFVVWGGSRNTDPSTYTTGTATFTQGSARITGSGTSWLANLDAGSIIQDNTTGYTGAVKSVDSNTQLTLARVWPGPTASGVGYTASSRRQTALINSVFSGGPVTALAAVGGRILGAVGTSVFPSIIDPNAQIGVADIMFTAEDSHEFGAPVLGLAGLRDTGIVFTDEGVYGIYGLAVDITDATGGPQRRQEVISRELVLWGQRGIAAWRGQLIVPTLSGLWLVSDAGAPQKISGDFEAAYLTHMRGNFKPGRAAVFEDHYVLPIVNTNTDAVDLFVVRLTANRAGRAMNWSQFRGNGGGDNIDAVAVRPPASAGSPPILLGGGADGRIHTLHWFEPSATYKDDADGTDHVFELQTRAFETGRNRRNYVDQVTVHYTLTDAASDNPTLELSYALDGATSWTVVSGTASESSGTIAKRTWKVGRAARTIQFRLRTSGAAATAKFRSIEVKTRDSARP